MAEVSLKPKPKESDIAWFSFYLQEHKTHSFGQKIMQITHFMTVFLDTTTPMNL